MKINIDEIEFKITLRDDTKMLAVVTLSIDIIEIRGFAIRPSKFKDGEKKLVLFPPSIRTGSGGWMHIMRITNKNDWELLENKILQEYDKQLEAATFERPSIHDAPNF